MTARLGRGTEAAPALCPSARCDEGAYLIGIVGADGVVGYVSPLLRVDAAFMSGTREGRDPERRFRFAQACVEGGCANWDGARCQVIDRAVAARASLAAGEIAGLPRCGIRPSCRWFRQSGPEACATCPLVITDLPSAAMRAVEESASAPSPDADANHATDPARA